MCRSHPDKFRQAASSIGIGIHSLDCFSALSGVIGRICEQPQIDVLQQLRMIADHVSKNPPTKGMSSYNESLSMVSSRSHRKRINGGGDPVPVSDRVRAPLGEIVHWVLKDTGQMLGIPGQVNSRQGPPRVLVRALAHFVERLLELPNAMVIIRGRSVPSVHEYDYCLRRRGDFLTKSFKIRVAGQPPIVVKTKHV